MIFDLIVDLEQKTQGRSIDEIVYCWTKKVGSRQADDAIKKLFYNNVIQSYTYNSNLCFKVKKNFENSNTDSYISYSETAAPLNISSPIISLKEIFDALKMKFIDDFESMKESFSSEIN